MGEDMQQKEILKKQNQEIAEKDNTPNPFLEWKFKRNEQTGKTELETIQLSDGSPMDKEKFLTAIQQATGSEDPIVAEKILRSVSHGLSADAYEARLNAISAMLPALKPQDEVEALLLGQFFALQESGLKCLRNGHSQESFYHIERLLCLAVKLLNVSNQTMQTLVKYRCKGQQVIQVLNIHNPDRTMIAQNVVSSTHGGRGPKEKKLSLNPMDH
jgi:hypothetical protein